jgi:undecaprenyl-phosphate galactose phosphotransferase/putative colanic acid biosynthesis UDP-glucose lipid carrier transferase
MRNELPVGRPIEALPDALDAVALSGGFVHRFGRAAFAGPVRSGARANVGSHGGRSILQDIADAALIVLLSDTVGMAYHWAAAKAPSFQELTYTGVIVAATFVASGRLFSTGTAWDGRNSFSRFKDAALSWTVSFAVLWFILFAFKASDMFSRGAILTFYLGCLPLIGLWKVASEPVIGRLARKGYGSRDAIVICDVTDDAADGFVAELVAMGYPSPVVVACRGLTDRVMNAEDQQDLLARAFAAARTCREGEIFVCAGNVQPERLVSLERALSVLPRAVYIVPEARTALLVRCRPKAVGHYVAVEVQREPLGLAERICKRAMDVALSLALIAFLAPPLIVIALAVKLDSNGPVFFRQIRNGYRGRPFRIFKFRTMTVLEDGPVVRQAARGDSRVTRVGRFLRRTSLDELPQLLNVLIGDMSLVGPRPHAKAHDDFYSKVIENYEVRQHVKPGMTGWAQVNGLRGATEELDAMVRRIEYDLWYASNASILFDCEILLRTAAEVFRQRNAY